MKLARTIARMNGTDANGTVHTTYVTGAVRVIAALALSAFAVSTFSPTAQAAEIRGGKLLMTGAGSTLINPLFSKWFYEYNKLNPKVEVNYQSIGSGGGIRQLQKRTIDFAATDVAMTEKEHKDAKDPVVHFPVAIGAVALTYNLPQLKTQLKLDSAAVIGIIRGRIKRWNDPALKALNPGVELPDQAIVFIYRSDSSGTTGVFTEYLGKVDTTFAKEVGVGKAIKWPTGLGGKGSEGVTANLKNTAGSIGYVELIYAENEKLPTVALKNSAGTFVTPNEASVSEAVKQLLKTIPEDFKVSLTNAPGKTTYPIAAFTYLLAFEKTKAPAGEELVRLLTWALGEGQSYTSQLGYVALPKDLAQKVRAKIPTVQP